MRIRMGATQLSSIPRMKRMAKKGPNELGMACNIMIVPHVTMFAPRYLPSRSRCAMYMEGKTQIKNPRGVTLATGAIR